MVQISRVFDVHVMQAIALVFRLELVTAAYCGQVLRHEWHAGQPLEARVRCHQEGVERVPEVVAAGDGEAEELQRETDVDASV